MDIELFRLGRLTKRVGIALGIQGVGAGLALLLQVVLARWLGANGYGAYAYLVAWASTLAVLGGVGLPTSALRFIPAYRAKSEYGRLHGFLRTIFVATLATGCAAWLLACAALFIYQQVHGEAMPLGTGIGLLLIPITAVMTLQTETIRIFHRVVLAFVPSLILRPTLILGGGALWLALEGTLSTGGALTVTVVSLALILAFQALLFWRDLSGKVKTAPPIYEWGYWFRVALPLLLMAGFGILLSQTDVIAVGILRGSTEAGFYTASAKIAGVVGLVLVAVNAIATPRLSGMFVRREVRRMESLAVRGAMLAFWPSLGLSIVLIAFGPYVLGLFGPDFAKSTTVLTVLLAGQVVNAAAGSVGYIMIMTGHQNTSVKVYACVAAGHLLLLPIAVSLFGSIGAATVTALSLATWNVWLSGLTGRKVGIRTSALAGIGSPARWSSIERERTTL